MMVIDWWLGGYWLLVAVGEWWMVGGYDDYWWGGDGVWLMIGDGSWYTWFVGGEEHLMLWSTYSFLWLMVNIAMAEQGLVDDFSWWSFINADDQWNCWRNLCWFTRMMIDDSPSWPTFSWSLLVVNAEQSVLQWLIVGYHVFVINVSRQLNAWQWYHYCCHGERCSMSGYSFIVDNDWPYILTVDYINKWFVTCGDSWWTTRQPLQAIVTIDEQLRWIKQLAGWLFVHDGHVRFIATGCKQQQQCANYKKMIDDGQKQSFKIVNSCWWLLILDTAENRKHCWKWLVLDGW